ncbi:phosphatidylserine/phosphatidylglycerophosphate/cardiolipin synthase family protein [Asticcacaulis sp. SL142]|uniref:phospholipase D-like domain-containing protein n=1 Tax=Asticcacaulis sp. SL142 TaxID=2995155 RepID=UPI00226D0B7D|nr:phosphatidylserine/phosphatidylglycerophosphate/cardiolipin synthase family protein [Asticcacaulis sp. SL142]WAC47146.1 phosphatidylserine/phosphatidylglycerophosphate/cardiolipin synthase family protein [Asticcacaulis sp. SL142]
MKFYLKSADAWAAMAQACEQATTCIDFEQYIVRDDEVGQRFLGLLARKAREGVKVRIVLDAFGSRTLLTSKVLDETRKSGAKVIFYHMQKPRRFVRIGGLFPRTHAKLLHVDDSATYLGSMCMAEYMRHWRDTMVALEGPAAIAARRDFDVLWRDLDDGQLDGDPGIIGGNRGGVYLAQNPKGGQRPLYEALLAAIMTARHSIRLATPYFFPPKRLRRALRDAQGRGVKISLLLSQHTDVAIADLITHALLGQWRRLDYDVRLYQPTVLHAKYAVIDDDWATLGSCNFDHLSLILNRECNLVMRDPGDVALLAAQFEEDCRHALPAGSATVVKTRWHNRLIGRLGAMISQAL